MSFGHVQSKCERYWCDEMNKPFETVGRGFTVTVTAKKVYADYEIRDITVRCVSVQGTVIHQILIHYDSVTVNLCYTSLFPPDW